MGDGGVDCPLKRNREARHDQILADLSSFISPLIREGPPFVEEKMHGRRNGIGRKKTNLFSPPVRKQLTQAHEDERDRPSHQDVTGHFHDKRSIEHSA